MAVKVQFQIGHSSKLRSKKTVEGFTHDWELYVKGVNQSDISAFVEKIIFNLHESFQKPKRVCNKPPYVIQESGYAGFLVFIDIYFRNRDEPKKVQFNYDLDLQTTGPPQHRHEIKTFIFDNPSEEFRQKLLKNGGVPVSGVVGGTQPALNNNIVAMPIASNINHSLVEGHKVITSEGKKHKLRPDDTRSNSFANLFGPPITKTSAVVPTVPSKHSPDNKTAVAAGHATHQGTTGTGLPVVKEKSSKDKEKSTEKSKERSEKREKHHKQSLTSPHKEGRSESKKTDGSKHEKRDKAEEKSKKDKNRDKDRERDRDKSSNATVSNNSSSNKRPPSPKTATEQSPHKPMVSGAVPTNTGVSNTNSLPRPSSSSSGKIEEAKSIKSSKESITEKSKDVKQKESSSSSSGKKSKKDKKDRDKDKDRDKEKRHDEREKQKLAENQQKSNAKEDTNKISNNGNTHPVNTANSENKSSKAAINPLNTIVANDVNKKPEKLAKQDLFKAGNEKNTTNATSLVPPVLVPATNSTTEKKSSSSSSFNANPNQPEKDKRSHKHKKKEKNKDKDKDREKDKERDKDKEKERDREKDKEKELKKDREPKDKHPEEKIPETNTNSSKHLLAPTNNTAIEEHASTISPSSTTSSAATPLASTPTIPLSSSLTSSSKSSKNKEKKSKEKSSSKEEKLKHKLIDPDTNESKAKQAKLSNNNNTSTSLSTSSSASSITTSIANAITPQTPNTNQPNAATAITNNSTVETNLNLDLSGADSLTAGSRQQVPPLPNDSIKKPLLKQPSPNITHSDSSNSSFPDLPPTKPPAPAPPTKQPAARERSKSIAAPIIAPPAPAAFTKTIIKEPPKPVKSAAKDKSADKPAKEDEKEKKRRRNSQAVNTFIEPPIKQLKAKEPTKSVREKSKSPSLRNTGSRASISVEGAATFLQPSASPSSTAAAAPLPPPSSAPSAAHSPALSATEAVGNATSATANAATCNNSSSAASTTANPTNMASAHHLPMEYLSELQELHHKIMTLQDNEDLQHVVELIAATGCYEITTKTFDFDLCKLDRGTVQRLQDFFATSVS